MTRKILFTLSIAGVIAGVVSAYFFGIQKAPLPPAFSPASNPFPKGIYALGIIESNQANGANVNLYPEVSGPVVQLLVTEGQSVTKGTSLLKVDDSVQRPTVDQLQAQAEAALSTLEELKAQPRSEVLAVNKAQVAASDANLKLARDTYEKDKASYAINPGSLSKDQLDTAENTFKLAKANLEVAQRNYELTKAGAWEFDIRTQEHQTEALRKAYLAADALLAKYTVKAPLDGVVLSINVALGSYVSQQGAYNTYTQGFDPVVVMGSPQSTMAVRCYIDEILVHRLPQSSAIKAIMRLRGTDISVPLNFLRKTPYVSPKIELSDQKLERVDVRVLPVIFTFQPLKGLTLYPGQQVDIFIEEKESGVASDPGVREEPPGAKGK